MEKKDDVTKDVLSKRTYESYPRHDVKTVLGDFDARVAKEGIFGIAVDKFNLHDETCLNGLGLIDFASARNMIIYSPTIQHRKIHKAT